MFRFVITERYIKLFKFVYESENPSIKEISKYTGVQYLHTLNVLKQFQEEKLIKPIFHQEQANHKENPGNPYIVELTPKGQAAHRLLNMLYRLHFGLDEDKIIKFIEGGEKLWKKQNQSQKLKSNTMNEQEF